MPRLPDAPRTSRDFHSAPGPPALLEQFSLAHLRGLPDEVDRIRSELPDPENLAEGATDSSLEERPEFASEGGADGEDRGAQSPERSH